MKISIAMVLALSLSTSVLAAPVSFDFTGSFTNVSGTYAGDIMVGYGVNGSFVYDTVEGNADEANTTPGTVPGHEFTSRYIFLGAPYGADFTIPALGDGLTHDGIEVLVNDNLFITSAETGGIIADGTYDFIELLASETIDVCPLGELCPPTAFVPGDGQEWTLAIFGPSNWFTDGSVIPDVLPAGYQALLVGLEFDADGNEVGAAFAAVNAVSAVPLPAAAWLFLSGLLGLVGISRRKKHSG